MINLAKRMKALGYPQERKGGHDLLVRIDRPMNEFAYIPTLDEVIEELGENFRNLAYRSLPKRKDWQAIGQIENTHYYGNADSPLEACMRLYVAIKEQG